MSSALTLTAAMLLAEPDPEMYLGCIVCGDTPTEWGLYLNADTGDTLGASAWCSKPDCQQDRQRTPALTAPFPAPDQPDIQEPPC